MSKPIPIHFVLAKSVTENCIHALHFMSIFSEPNFMVFFWDCFALLLALIHDFATLKNYSDFLDHLISKSKYLNLNNI